MLDATRKQVELVIRPDGKMVWLNVDGVCAVRVSEPALIVVDDQRKPELRPKTLDLLAKLIWHNGGEVIIKDEQGERIDELSKALFEEYGLTLENRT